MVKDKNGSVLTTFECVEWESEVNGIVLARCYPFNMPIYINPQVLQKETKDILVLYGISKDILVFA